MNVTFCICIAREMDFFRNLLHNVANSATTLMRTCPCGPIVVVLVGGGFEAKNDTVIASSIVSLVDATAAAAAPPPFRLFIDSMVLSEYARFRPRGSFVSW